MTITVLTVILDIFHFAEVRYNPIGDIMIVISKDDDSTIYVTVDKQNIVTVNTYQGNSICLDTKSFTGKEKNKLCDYLSEMQS